MKLQTIATQLGARVVPAPGTATYGTDVEITGVAGIEEAGPGQLTFVANPKYASAAKTTRASAIIVTEDFPAVATATLRTANPYLAFARAIELFYQPPRYLPGVHPSAVIHPSAKIGKNASIAACVVVEADVEIGDDCVLLPHVVIYRGAKIGRNFFAHAHAVVREYCEVGDGVVLQNGAIIGADGFGFAKDGELWRKIVQSGTTILENDVEVQANACIDRASVGETRIASGAKIDNLTQVGHGSSVGENSLLCAQVGLAGSTVIGRNVILAGQVGVAGHCTVGDGAVATAQSGIRDVPPGTTVSGTPAIDNRQWLRCIAAFNKLPEMAKTLRARTPDEKKSK
jgi:UDP-3-O-[3-hydroxymyristoyl] glucosamine N-acyltransferase